MKFTQIALLALVSLSMPACIIVAERGSGDRAEQVRQSEEFSRISLPGGGIDHVDIVVCDCTAIRVSGDDNLLDYVETSVSGDTLTVDTVARLRTREELVVEIRTPSLELVEMSGSSTVSIVDLRGGDLTVSASGSGDVDFVGKLDRLRFETSGSSDVDVDRLEVDSLEIDTSGSTDIIIRDMISNDIQIHTSGSSDIDMTGEANSLVIETSGSSDVRASGMRTATASVNTSGSSDIEVCVTDLLEVDTSGSGDVTYYCSPGQIDAHTSGSGSVRAGK